MKMTQKLANDLMDCLGALMISANGTMPKTDEEREKVQTYVTTTFLNLCDYWADLMEEEWEVIPEEPSLADLPPSKYIN